MFKFLVVTFSFLSLFGCSTVSSKKHFEETMQTAKNNVENRESTLPDDFKTGNGNAKDIQKGLKHSTNKDLVLFFLSLFNDDK